MLVWRKYKRVLDFGALWSVSTTLTRQPMKRIGTSSGAGERPRRGEETYDGGDALPEGEGLLHHRDARGRHAGGGRGHEGREGQELKHCVVDVISGLKMGFRRYFEIG